MLFNLQVIGEAVKALPPAQRAGLPPRHQSGPARLRDLIAHHHFAIDAEIIWDVVTNHVPMLLAAARRLRGEADGP